MSGNRLQASKRRKRKYLTMPLYKCTKCGCIDNTAMGNFWTANAHGEPELCTECDPEIGVWHGKFVKRQAAEADTPRLWGNLSYNKSKEAKP
jgi:hypothetical protein